MNLGEPLKLSTMKRCKCIRHCIVVSKLFTPGQIHYYEERYVEGDICYVWFDDKLTQGVSIGRATFFNYFEHISNSIAEFENFYDEAV